MRTIRWTLLYNFHFCDHSFGGWTLYVNMPFAERPPLDVNLAPANKPAAQAGRRHGDEQYRREALSTP